MTSKIPTPCTRSKMIATNGRSQSSNTNNVARQRWRLLGKALRQHKDRKSAENSVSRDVSVRRFTTYGLLHTRQLPYPDHEQYSWYEYSSPLTPDLKVKIRHLNKQFSPEELIGFNNTGNVCVWPAEEVLAHYCLQNRHAFREKTVCELGGGMSCLAGVAVAASSEASRVILTDGNKLSCDNVQEIVERNRERFSGTCVNVRELRWNEASSYHDLRNSTDVILCADCLFFDQYRMDLIVTIDSLLTSEGEAIIFAPPRGHTLEKFCQQAKDTFHLTLEENYDPSVWSAYQQAKLRGKEVFDEDIHYPLKITIRRTKGGVTHHPIILNSSNGNEDCPHY